MEEIFKLTMDEPFENSTHISSTSQILQDCLLIIESPSHDSYKSSDSNSPVSTKVIIIVIIQIYYISKKSNRRIISSFINQNFKQSGILIK